MVVGTTCERRSLFKNEKKRDELQQIFRASGVLRQGALSVPHTHFSRGLDSGGEIITAVSE